MGYQNDFAKLRRKCGMNKFGTEQVHREGFCEYKAEPSAPPQTKKTRGIS
jgi:hypothetical protein